MITHPHWRWSLSLAFVACLSACRPEAEFGKRGPLAFSADTVRFDTIFYNVPSPHERLRVYNQTGNNITIDEVYIEGGEASPFRLTLDGVVGQRHTNYEMLKGDSLYVFVQMTGEVQFGQHQLLTDFLVFRSGSDVQRIPLEVLVLNAYRYQNVRVTCPNGQPIELPQDTLIVIDGVLQVDSGCTCRIRAGTNLYFTARRDSFFSPASVLQVFGRLEVLGTAATPVLFTNLRLGADYERVPGDWYGIQFFPGSAGLIQHAEVQNAAIGVTVSAQANLGIAGAPTVVIEHSQFRNMSYYGLLGVGLNPGLNPNVWMIDATNVAAYNCGESSVACVFGGSARFRHCTFAEYGWQLRRNSPSALLTDVRRRDAAGNVIYEEYPGNFAFHNCIIYGSEADELGLDVRPGTPLVFEHCLIRTEEYAQGLATNGNILNADPKFREQATLASLNLRPAAASPARDAGANLGIGIDLSGNARTPPPDIGAWEYQPD